VPGISNPLNSIAFRLKLGLPNALASVGLLKRRPQGPLGPAGWDREYDTGEMEREAGVSQLAHYGVLIAYLVFFDARKILDVGCGMGVLRQRLAALPFERYAGVDPSPAAIERAKALEDERTTFAVAERATPAMGTFDAVVCNEMLYYLEDLDGFLDYVDSILEPGGHLLSSIWRHPRDVLLHQALDEHFALVDAVDVVQRSGSVRPIWRVFCHKKRG
jgi:2-polyprenyl-3-methyl-5-hydroxy-6-metoxy-1,4-benzoquinol methylase